MDEKFDRIGEMIDGMSAMLDEVNDYVRKTGREQVFLRMGNEKTNVTESGKNSTA